MLEPRLPEVLNIKRLCISLKLRLRQSERRHCEDRW